MQKPELRPWVASTMASPSRARTKHSRAGPRATGSRAGTGRTAAGRRRGGATSAARGRRMPGTPSDASGDGSVGARAARTCALMRAPSLQRNGSRSSRDRRRSAAQNSRSRLGARRGTRGAGSCPHLRQEGRAPAAVFGVTPSTPGCSQRERQLRSRQRGPATARAETSTSSSLELQAASGSKRMVAKGRRQRVVMHRPAPAGARPSVPTQPRSSPWRRKH